MWICLTAVQKISFVIPCAIHPLGSCGHPHNQHYHLQDQIRGLQRELENRDERIRRLEVGSPLGVPSALPPAILYCPYHFPFTVARSLPPPIPQVQLRGAYLGVNNAMRANGLRDSQVPSFHHDRLVFCTAPFFFPHQRYPFLHPP